VYYYVLLIGDRHGSLVAFDAMTRSTTLHRVARPECVSTKDPSLRVRRSFGRYAPSRMTMRVCATKDACGRRLIVPSQSAYADSSPGGRAF